MSDAQFLVMDPESVTFQPREDYWRFQGEMLRVQQGQAELADRVSRLERRHEEDSRLKNVWGTSSPFPSVLGGTPQQVPLQQPTAEHFSNFDETSSNLIGNLQLDADDEPRRIGTTSRANSVRFDETANHGHWAHASRSSLDLIPRTGSGLGGHVMSERSYSHKSDGRQSSAGHSVHSVASGRANSLTSYGLNTPSEPPGLAPGLFILGSVPAIIRCWLHTDFKHDTLLYAAVCSGSYTSSLDLRLVESLGFRDQITLDKTGARQIKLPLYLPEAVPLSASSRSSSPAPQLPSLIIDFTVVEHDRDSDSKAIQIFLGSDVLRAHNADILLSTNHLTLYDDERVKLQIPLVRPEDERTFKSLFVRSGPLHGVGHQPTAGRIRKDTPEMGKVENDPIVDSTLERTAYVSTKPDVTAAGNSSDDGISSGRPSFEQGPYLGLHTNRMESKEDVPESGLVSAAPRPGPSQAIWSNWRRDTEKSNSMDWPSAGKNTNPTYQRRDTGIKVLKPTKSGVRTLSSGAPQTSSPAPTSQSRFFDEGRRRLSNAGGNEVPDPQLKRAVSGEKSKESAPVLTKTRSSNPIGGASAFPWLNNGGSK